jgi:soluble lytic murein transglycosylase-like protein
MKKAGFAIACLLIFATICGEEPVLASISVQAPQAPVMAGDRLEQLQDEGIEAFRYLPPPEYAKWVYLYCAEQGLPVDSICRIAWDESHWNPKAVNRSGEKCGLGVDRGLLQLNSRNLEEWAKMYNSGVKINPYDPETNLRVGIRHYGDLVRQYGTFRLAYTAWNAGRSQAFHPPRKTKVFVAKLTKN